MSNERDPIATRRNIHWSLIDSNESDLILQTCPRPAFNYFSVVPVGSNENAFKERKKKIETKKKSICEYNKLTERRSGRYPRLAAAEAIPRARRLPDRGRMVDVAWAEATAWGEAFVLRVTIFIPEGESVISMTYSKSNIFRSWTTIKRNEQINLGVGQPRVFVWVQITKVSLACCVKTVWF